MDLARINNEFRLAKQQFSYLELNPTSDGKVYARVAIQASEQLYIASIRFPENYPNTMPTVYIDKPVINNGPHRYNGGHICYLHPDFWNPGIHNLSFVIARTAKWLNKHEVWKVKGVWPGAGLAH